MSNAVFCHYMVTGMSNASQAALDVTQAHAMGFNAFALNLMSNDTTSSWQNPSLEWLFAAALAVGFKLFFSFDMTHFTDPSQFDYFLDTYMNSTAYYLWNDDGVEKPFVSTFYGGTLTFGDTSVNAGWQDNFKDKYPDVYFAPSFSDATRLPYTTQPKDMYTTFPVADALFCWDCAWPEIDANATEGNSIDQTYQTAAVAASKDYMMPMSTLQFKHLDKSANNWYRNGELNLADRMAEVFTVNPTFLEYITWNDGPESHYIGNVWNESIEGSPSHDYIDGFDHSGWQNIIVPFISAYKAGKTSVADVLPLDSSAAVGTFWYRPILSTTPCTSDAFGQPNGYENAKDVINVAVILSSAATGSTIKVSSGGSQIGTETGTTGLNSWSFTGMTTGAVEVEVVDSTGATILSATGGMQVAATASVCNYNYYVVPLGTGGAAPNATSTTTASATSATSQSSSAKVPSTTSSSLSSQVTASTTLNTTSIIGSYVATTSSPLSSQGTASSALNTRIANASSVVTSASSSLIFAVVGSTTLATQIITASSSVASSSSVIASTLSPTVRGGGYGGYGHRPEASSAPKDSSDEETCEA